jgi:hypothetical protein
MNKPLKTTSRKSALTFGDLVAAVSSESHNSREAAAAIIDLFRSGRVTFSAPRRKTRLTR